MHFKQLLKNVFSLTIIQAVNYLLPIIILPYLIQKVGIMNFGLSSYALTLLMPAKIFIDYGFNLSGVKDVATNKSNNFTLNRIASSIFFTKIYLLVITFFLFLTILVFVPKFNSYFLLFLLSFLVIVGQSLVPVWYFQGIEETQVLLVLSVATRIAYLILIYVLVRSAENYIYINFCLGLADLLLSFCCMVYIVKRKKIALKPISVNAFLNILKQNFILAKTNVYVMLSITLPFTILGFFATPVIIGYYSIADKILQIVRASAVILYNSAFPRVIQLYQSSTSELKKFIIKFSTIVAVGYSFVFIVCILFTDSIIKIITNNSVASYETVISIKILALIPLLAAFDIVPSHILLITKQYKKYASLLFITTVVSLVLSFILIPVYSYIGAAIACLATELTMLGLLYFVNNNFFRQLYFERTR